MPDVTITRTVMNRVQSVLSCCAILGPLLFDAEARRRRASELIYELFECLAAVFEAGELVEARARGGEQHRVAGRCVRIGVGEGGIQRTGFDQRNGAVDLFC